MALLPMATPTVALLTMGLQGGALGVITRERLQRGEELGVDQRHSTYHGYTYCGSTHPTTTTTTTTALLTMATLTIALLTMAIPAARGRTWSGSAP